MWISEWAIRRILGKRWARQFCIRQTYDELMQLLILS
jgi:hypothetical protein